MDRWEKLLYALCALMFLSVVPARADWRERLDDGLERVEQGAEWAGEKIEQGAEKAMDKTKKAAETLKKKTADKSSD